MRGRRIPPPLFWGHLRSVSQGMMFGVQPFVKSLFCPIRQSPNGFFDSKASIPQKHVTFLTGGGGGWAGGGGSKVFAQKVANSAEADWWYIKPRLNGNAADRRGLGPRFDSWLVNYRRRGCRRVRPTRVRTAEQKVRRRLHYHLATACPENSSCPRCLEPGGGGVGGPKSTPVSLGRKS